MEIVLVVVFLAMCGVSYLRAYPIARNIKQSEVPEEMMARLMPSEYPMYKRLFEMQAREKMLSFPTLHS